MSDFGLITAVVLAGIGFFLTARFDLYDGANSRWRRASEPEVVYAYVALHVCLIGAGAAIFFLAGAR